MAKLKKDLQEITQVKKQKVISNVADHLLECKHLLPITKLV